MLIILILLMCATLAEYSVPSIPRQYGTVTASAVCVYNTNDNSFVIFIFDYLFRRNLVPHPSTESLIEHDIVAIFLSHVKYATDKVQLTYSLVMSQSCFIFFVLFLNSNTAATKNKDTIGRKSPRRW